MEPPSKQASRPLISVNLLTKKYGQFQLFDQLTFDLYENEKIAITGTNGCGKSTLLEILSSITSFDEGHYYFDRIDTQKHAKTVQKQICFCPDINLLQTHLSVEEHLNLSLSLAQVNPQHLSHAIHLQKRFSVSAKMHYPVHRLSSGEQKQVMLIQYLSQDKRLYLFDEPTNHLDDNEQMIFFECINKLQSLGKTIIYVSHYERDLKHADRCYQIHNKQIIETTPKQQLDSILFQKKGLDQQKELA